MIRRCHDRDFESIWTIINDGALAYRGVIPADRLPDPYMSRETLAHEIADGVVFWAEEVDTESAGATLLGVMGTQTVQDVTLIRHAYVRTVAQHRGVGARLLHHLRSLTDRPVLIGTWADAAWAIRFYQRRGFHVVDTPTRERLLRTYWKVPERQIKTSVVLADRSWPPAAS